MGLVLIVAVLAVLVGLVLGGRPSGLARLRLHAPLLLLAAAVVQLADAALGSSSPVPWAVTVGATTVLAGLFVVLNLGLPGVGLMGLGLLLNAAVSLLNGAMPVSHRAAQAAGVDWQLVTADPRHVPLDESTALGFLGDVIPVASPLHAEVVSVGDVLVAAGLALLLVAGMRRVRRTSPLPSLAGRQTA